MSKVAAPSQPLRNQRDYGTSDATPTRMAGAKMSLRKILAAEGINVRATLRPEIHGPRPFTKTDWYAYGGASSWFEKGVKVHEPWLVELTFDSPVTMDLPGVGEFPVESAVIIADSEGLTIEAFNEDGGDSTGFIRKDWEPEEAEGALKAALRKFLAQQFPSGMDFSA